MKGRESMQKIKMSNPTNLTLNQAFEMYLKNVKSETYQTKLSYLTSKSIKDFLIFVIQENDYLQLQRTQLTTISYGFVMKYESKMLQSTLILELSERFYITAWTVVTWNLLKFNCAKSKNQSSKLTQMKN